MYEGERRAVRVAQLVRVVQRRRGIRADAREQDVRQALALGQLEQLAGVHAVDEFHREEVVVIDFAES